MEKERCPRAPFDKNLNGPIYFIFSFVAANLPTRCERTESNFYLLSQ